MVFVPFKEIEITPDEINLAYEDVFVDVEPDVTINAWYFPASDSGRTVLFCHGNAGNISHRLETVRFLLDQGSSVLLFDYRGYGRSTGSPSEDGLYADAVACYKWLIEKKGVTPDNLVIFGRSLGGAVAVELASQVECSGVIVESSFTSAAAMGRNLFPFFPIQLILRYKFDTVDKIGQLKQPVLIAHSPQDDIVPFAMGQKLFEAATEPKTFIELSGGHNELVYLVDSEYVSAIRSMLRPI